MTPTLALHVPAALGPQEEAPGRWWYGSAEALRAELRPGLMQGVVSDDRALLQHAHSAGAELGVLLLTDPEQVVGPAAALLPAISAIVTPFERVARRARAAWPSLADRVLRFSPVLARREGPLIRRAAPRPLGGAEALALLTQGAPVVCARSGLGPDLVRLLGGALVNDALGSAAERAEIDGYDGPLTPPAAHDTPTLVPTVLALWRSLPRERIELAPLWACETTPGEEGIVLSPPPALPRAAVAAALEAVTTILGADLGPEGDRLEVASWPPSPPLPQHAERLRRPRLAACLIVGRPRQTLPGCLASLVDAVDAVCVVTTQGPDPRLAALCASLGLPLHTEDRAWTGDFAEARDASLTLAEAHADYALVIDDDEQLVGAKALRALAQSWAVECVSLPILNLEPSAGAQQQTMPRLVRLGAGWRFDGPIHECLAAPRGRSERLLTVQAPYLVHSGYADPLTVHQKLHQRNRPLTEQHAQAGHPRVAGVRLRDLVDADAPLTELADAAWRFQSLVIDAGRWPELLAWGEVYGRALQRLGRGFVWDGRVPVPGAGVGLDMRIGFLSTEDLRRFLDWWLTQALARGGALVGEESAGADT